ncbi:uncharacterized protein [Hyperolius riggenbachi]|uniref:uncharacterized protein isoform X2 n=1 Tax=Hyperolius riggenbachi TaxID=752182 RepID=UPI0035A35C16
MGIFCLLSILGQAFSKILNLCSMAWNPFFWYKITWRFLLQFSQEIRAAIIFGRNSPTGKENQISSLSNEDQQSDGEELRDELRRMQDISTSSVSKLHTFEEKVGMLEVDLSEEKQLWRTRYQELLVEQKALKEQERCVLPEGKTSENSVHPSDDEIDGIVESNLNIGDGLHQRLGHAVRTCTHPCNSVTTLDGYKNSDLSSSFTCCSPMQKISVSYPNSTEELKNPKSYHVMVPHSPLDLKIGSRVKVILPSGRVGTGAVYRLGQLPGKVEFQVGVDLETPQCQHWTGVVKDHNFPRDSCSGVTVPFSKVLMVWK